jgi:hypothetical protein
MKKTLLIVGLAAALCVPFALSGCASSDSNGSGDAGASSSQTESASSSDAKVDAGIVSLDELKAGMKYLNDATGATYEATVEAFGNEGEKCKEDDETISYEWKTEDGENSILVTYWASGDNAGQRSGYSWSGDEIKEYKDSL